MDIAMDASTEGCQFLIGHIADQSLSPMEAWFQRAVTGAVFDFRTMRFDREEIRVFVDGEFGRSVSC